MVILADSKEALDAALANRMVALATSCDARCKRQATAVAATQASIVEIEAALAALDAQQGDLLKQDDTKKDETVTPTDPRPVNRRR